MILSYVKEDGEFLVAGIKVTEVVKTSEDSGATIQCDYPEGKHEMHFIKKVDVYGTNNIYRFLDWNLYRCDCNAIIVCKGTPPTASIEEYFESYYDFKDDIKYYVLVSDETPVVLNSNSLDTVVFYE